MPSNTRTSGMPLSPHLQIYRPQITSALSIFHRITGVAASLGALMLAYWLISAAAGPGPFSTAQAIIGSWLGYLVLFGFSVAVFYHLCNGIRHLVWDAGFGFDLKSVERGGYAVLAGTGVLTVLAWIIGLSM